MTGILLTGHGRFADGLTSSIELIAGPQKNWHAVNFENDVDQLEKDIQAVMEQYKDTGLLVFTDLAGGSPFKTAAQLSVAYPDTHVIAGTNLPMLAEAALARGMDIPAEALAVMALNTGKDQVVKFRLEDILPVQEEEDEDYSDGI